MHYDYKMKLNKVDSNVYKNFRIEETDAKLNEAIEIFIKRVAEPRKTSHLGFEKSQRIIDDIRPLVVNEDCINVVNNIVALPPEYMFYLRGDVTMTKGTCTDVKGKIHVQQHDDSFEESVFDKSSFEWRHVNALFTEQGMKLYTDGSFTVSQCC